MTSTTDAAREFLLSRQSAAGWWVDYETLAGESDEWVTAYVAAGLGDTGGPDATRAARRAWTRLKRRRLWSGGWGYNRRVPSDADTTAWALRLAAALDENESLTARRACRFLGRHAAFDGGLSTFATDGPIRRFIDAPREVSFRGWCHPHVSVTAAAVTVLSGGTQARALEYLRASQRPDGSWGSYWWANPEYPTVLAAEALDSMGTREDRHRVDTAVQWARRQCNDGPVRSELDGTESPFATACCLELLSLGRDDAAIAAAVHHSAAWLARHQRRDGSWRGSALLRIPPPDVEDPDAYNEWRWNAGGGGSVQPDQNRLFTTTTALRALTSVPISTSNEQRV